jgi:hypothetical protein
MFRQILISLPVAKQKFALSVIALVVVAGVAVSARAWLASAAARVEPRVSPAISAGVASTAVSSTANLAPILGPVGVMRLTIYDAGLYPRQVHASIPHVTISVEDLSGGSSGLFIQPNPSSLPILVFNGVAFVPVPSPALLTPPTSTGSVSTGGTLRWRADLWLAPGSYLISDASRSRHQMVLVVDPPSVPITCGQCKPI